MCARDYYTNSPNYWAISDDIEIMGRFHISIVTSLPKTKRTTTSNNTCQLKIKMGESKSLEVFFYPGSKITTDNSYGNEIRAKFLTLNRSYLSLQKLFCSKCLTSPHVFLEGLTLNMENYELLAEFNKRK